MKTQIRTPYKCKFLKFPMPVRCRIRIWAPLLAWGGFGCCLNKCTVSIEYYLWKPNYCSILNDQPAIAMTSEFQILWKWIDCITTNAWRQWLLLCASASHIMTLTLAYIWLRCIISSVSICRILMLIASHTEYGVQYTFNILLFRIFSLLIFAFVYCVLMVFVLCVCGGMRAADSFLWQWHHKHHHVCTAQLKCSILLGHCMHPHLLFVCTSYAGISASRKHISKLSKQTNPHPHFGKQRKR